MALRQIGDKPLSEPMLTRFTDALYAELRGDELNEEAIGLLSFNSLNINGNHQQYK